MIDIVVEVAPCGANQPVCFYPVSEFLKIHNMFIVVFATFRGLKDADCAQVQLTAQRCSVQSSSSPLLLLGNGEGRDLGWVSVVLAVKRRVHGEFAAEHQLPLPSVAWTHTHTHAEAETFSLSRLCTVEVVQILLASWLAC